MLSQIVPSWKVSMTLSRSGGHALHAHVPTINRGFVAHARVTCEKLRRIRSMMLVLTSWKDSTTLESICSVGKS